MRYRFAAYLLSLGLAAGVAFADTPRGNAASVTIPLQVTVTAASTPLAGNANPSNPSLACNAPPGTIISAITTSGGDGNPVTLTFAAGSDASYALSATTAPSNVIVGIGGVLPADCGTTKTYNITATQP